MNEINVRDKTLLNTPLANRSSWSNKNQLGGRGSSFFGGFGGGGGPEESSGDEGPIGGGGGGIDGRGGSGVGGGVTRSLLDSEGVRERSTGVKQELQEKPKDDTDRGKDMLSMTSPYKAPVTITPLTIPPTTTTSGRIGGVGTTTFGGPAVSRTNSSAGALTTSRPSVGVSKIDAPVSRTDSAVRSGVTGYSTTGFGSPSVPRSNMGAIESLGSPALGYGSSRINPSRFSSSSHSSGSPVAKPSGGYKPTAIVSLSSPPRSAANSATMCEARIVDIPKPEAPTLPPGSASPSQTGVLRISSL